MTSLLRMLALAFFALGLFSCEKDLSPDDLKVHLEENFPLKDLLLFDDAWMACGGVTFEKGVIVEGSYNNNTTVIDSVYTTCVNSINLKEDIYSAGVYSIGKATDGMWNIIGIPDLYIMRETLVYNERVYAIGGAGLSSGVLYKFDKELSLLETTILDNDLYFIREINGRIFVGGFGRLMFSDDMVEWTILDEFEDQFIDIDFSGQTGILVLGASGRLIQSKNEGLTWNEILAPNFSGLSDFSDLLITDQNIYIAGEEKICASDIENIDWKTIGFKTMGKINKMAENNQRIFFVTSEGKMASIAH